MPLYYGIEPVELMSLLYIIYILVNSLKMNEYNCIQCPWEAGHIVHAKVTKDLEV